MWSGKLAARSRRKIPRTRQTGCRAFAGYEKRVRKGLMFYWRMVENYYTTPFMELFLRPTERFNLFSAVVGVLAGEVEGSWALRWRMELFFLLVKIQARWPFSPRINFRPIVIVTKNPPSMHAARMKLRGAIFVAPDSPFLSVGCRTAPPLPPADFSAPGWRVQQGQAVWKPSSSRPELAGDLLLATNANGNFFIQFSKIPFPLATAQVSGGQWQIEFGADKYSWHGRGAPPDRFVWFQLPRALLGEMLAGDWKFHERRDKFMAAWKIRAPAKVWRANFSHEMVSLVVAAASRFRSRSDSRVCILTSRFSTCCPQMFPPSQGLKIYQQHFANARELIVTVKAPDRRNRRSRRAIHRRKIARGNKSGFRRHMAAAVARTSRTNRRTHRLSLAQPAAGKFPAARRAAFRNKSRRMSLPQRATNLPPRFRRMKSRN